MKQWTLKDIGRANLELVEAEAPTPAENEILVKVSAVALNYRDILLIEDGLGLPGDIEAFVPGSDAAGVVVATGNAVNRFETGDQVISTFIPGWVDGPAFGTAREPSYRTLGGAVQGVLSEYVVLDQDWAVNAPESLNESEASTLCRTDRLDRPRGTRPSACRSDGSGGRHGRCWAVRAPDRSRTRRRGHRRLRR